jgi:hypothetical protein
MKPASSPISVTEDREDLDSDAILLAAKNKKFNFRQQGHLRTAKKLKKYQDAIKASKKCGVSV